MKNVNLEMLVDKAGEMALHNIWGENAYKINMAILKMDHTNSAACTRLAKYYRLNDNITEAKNMYLKALDIDPNNRGAINNLHDIERDQKENDDIDKIKTTSELFKEGKHSVVKGKYKLAVKLFKKAYSMDPLLMYAVSLAGVYKKMGDFDRIVKLYKQLIEDSHLQANVEDINSEFKTLGLDAKSLT